MADEDAVQKLTLAITEHRRVRLTYSRQADEVTSIHEVAPIDIRGGDTPRTKQTFYLWAWCFAEDKLERHLLDRIVRVDGLQATFDPGAIYRRWPEGWPMPDTWNIPRSE
jgi:predicted DNA-binding transcriptional regulator YafY